MKANKKPTQSNLLDKLRKAFMTRDSEAFEQAANEMTGDEGGEASGVPQIHVHVQGNGAPQSNAENPTVDNGGEAGAGAGAAGGGAESKILEAITALSGKVDAIGERVTKLEGGGSQTGDNGGNGGNPKTITGDGDGGSGDGDGEGGGSATRTGDSTDLRDQFQETMSRAEIIAPGIKLPTFDAKTDRKRTVDAMCSLRRRAMQTALDGDHAEIIKDVTGGADISKMTCDATTAYFNAAVSAVKLKRASKTTARTGDSNTTQRKDINQIHADFWKSQKK